MKPRALSLLLALLALAVSCDGSVSAQSEEPKTDGQSCRECHRKLNPGLVADLEASPHEKVPVRCRECHGSFHDHIFRMKGEVPTTVCQNCHPEQYDEFRASRHGRHLKEGKPDPTLRQHAFAVGNCTVTTGCHSIQYKYSDGSVGKCGVCHPTHSFSNHEARNPRICYTCHAGEDNSEYQSWRRSAHSLKATSGKGHVADCVECHGTHDVSGGITHGLSPVATETPELFVPTLSMEEFTAARDVMLSRCKRCHGTRFARTALRKADDWRRRGALLVQEAEGIVRRLHAAGKLGPAPEKRIPNPVCGTAFRLGGAQIFDLEASVPERIYYDMRYHLYPALWRAAYHNDPERVVWELNDRLKGALDRLRQIEREVAK